MSDEKNETKETTKGDVKTDICKDIKSQFEQNIINGEVSHNNYVNSLKSNSVLLAEKHNENLLNINKDFKLIF